MSEFITADAFISLIKAWASQRNPMFTSLASLPNSVVEPTPTDPLDVTYDGVPLRELVTRDELRRRREHRGQYGVTPAQSAAISANWSAQLRAKVAASADRERARVLVDLQEIE